MTDKNSQGTEDRPSGNANSTTIKQSIEERAAVLLQEMKDIKAKCDPLIAILAEKKKEFIALIKEM